MVNFLLVGDANSGKSTLVYESVGRMNFSCGGVISIPVNEHGEKVGTDALDIMTENTVMLARKGNSNGIKVGRYILSMEGLKHGIDAIYNATEKCNLVVVDEFGPLEMSGRGLAKATEYALENSKVLIVIRRKLKDEFLEKYRDYKFKIINVDDVDADNLAEMAGNDINRKL